MKKRLIIVLYFPLLLFLNSCHELCDGDSFFEWLTVEYQIIDSKSGNDFFLAYQNPDYNLYNLKVYDLEGKVYDDQIGIFENKNGMYEKKAAMKQPISKIYYFQYNDYDTDTMRVVVKGVYSDPCQYEECEYLKVYYNEKLVYYGFRPGVFFSDDDKIKLYKSI